MMVYILKEFFNAKQNSSLILGVYSTREKAESERENILAHSKDVRHIDLNTFGDEFWTHDCFAVHEYEVKE